jgi:tartrate dehydrogenase/decarboxylase/D-malate dehydrogenase
MMPAGAIETLRAYDAIYVGAVGSPGVPDDVTLWGLLLPIRQVLDLYVNLRPVRLLPGVESPLRATAEIDMLCVRENLRAGARATRQAHERDQVERRQARVRVLG